MRKGSKRTPLPAPALTEKDLAHLNWIRQNSTHLVRSALKLYRRGGRGAFIVREEEAKPSGTAALPDRYGRANNRYRLAGCNDGRAGSYVRSRTAVRHRLPVPQWRSQFVHDSVCQAGGYIHGRNRLAHLPALGSTRASGCCSGRL